MIGATDPFGRILNYLVIQLHVIQLNEINPKIL
jgi:hypothetical protein